MKGLNLPSNLTKLPSNLMKVLAVYGIIDGKLCESVGSLYKSVGSFESFIPYVLPFTLNGRKGVIMNKIRKTL